MKIAEITAKGKKNHLGILHSIKDQLVSAAKSRGLSIQFELRGKKLLVPIGFPRKEIDLALSHMKDLPYEIKEIEWGEIITVSESDSKVPADYGLLQGKVKAQSAEIEVQGKVISGLEQRVSEETQSRISIQADLDGARAKYKEILEAKDFVAQNMLRVNSRWNTFVNLYADTLEHASKIYDMPQDVLEREVLTFSSLQEREDFKEISRDLENAKAAKEAAEKNRLLRMDPYAQQILNKASKIEKRQDIISQLRRELGAHIGKEKQWIVLTSKDKETLLNLAFTYNPNGQYHDLEKPLIEAINQSLTDSHLEYNQKEVNGLLGYVIHGMKPRAMARLDKAISLTEDPFVKLCGERQVIQIIS